MKRKWQVGLVFAAFGMVPVFMVAVAWYVGLFAAARLEIRVFEEQTALVRNYNGDYNSGSLAVRNVKLRLKDLGIVCRPVLVLLEDDKKIIKAHLAGQGGCIVPKGIHPADGEFLRKIPSGTYEVAVSRAHPVFALKKNLRLLREHSKNNLNFPLVLLVDERGEQVLRQLKPQTSMQ